MTDNPIIPSFIQERFIELLPSIQERYIELLKRSKDLQDQQKSLFDENRDEWDELIAYDILLENTSVWENRDEIILKLKQFLNKEIDGETLCDYTFELRKRLLRENNDFRSSLISNPKKVKNIPLDLRASGFSTFLSNFFGVCEYCEDYFEHYEVEELFSLVEKWHAIFDARINSAEP